jgi:hypothetical protein
MITQNFQNTQLDIYIYIRGDIGVFFVTIFCHLATKKKGLVNPTKGFLRIFLKNSSYLEKNI